MSDISSSLKYYRTNPRRTLMQRYNDMKRRTQGKPAGDRKSQIWLGMELCDQTEFVDWSMNNSNFLELWEAWVAADNQRTLAPSVHRIDRTRGYTLDNIEWRTHIEKARESLAKGKETRAAKRANQG